MSKAFLTVFVTFFLLIPPPSPREGEAINAYGHVTTETRDELGIKVE